MCRRVGGKLVAATMSTGRTSSTPTLLRVGHQVRVTASIWSSSSSESPTSWPCAARKVNAMPPPIKSRSTLASRFVDHPELVGDLRATEHDHVGPHEFFGQPSQHLDLGEHQAAGRVRQPLRQVVHARMLAVHRAEPVADVAAARTSQRGELVGEGAPLGVVLAGLCRARSAGSRA